MKSTLQTEETVTVYICTVGVVSGSPLAVSSLLDKKEGLRAGGCHGSMTGTMHTVVSHDSKFIIPSGVHHLCEGPAPPCLLTRMGKASPSATRGCLTTCHGIKNTVHQEHVT